MTVNSAVILMCQSCNDGGYLFILFIYLLLFYDLFYTYSRSVMSSHISYFSTCYVNTLRLLFDYFLQTLYKFDRL